MIRIFAFLGGMLLALGGRVWAATEFVVLVTGDGIRHQEVFTGVDPKLAIESAKKSSGIEDITKFRAEFWAEDPKARREKLMPFFWKELSRQGVIYGNRALGSTVQAKNPHHFSYPGYAEILNGGPVAEITSNDPVWSPRETVLEYIRRELGLQAGQVAVFGSWRIFNWMAMQREGAVFCNAGYEAMPPELSNEKMKPWSALQFEIRSPWDTVRHDAITLELALEYIQLHKPKVMYLALGETDDWAHDRRYDRTIQSLRYFDEALKRLWELLQKTEPYAGRTALIVTTDHGRGRTAEDWTSHGKDVPGADEAWLGVFGPGVSKRGEMKNSAAYSLGNAAPTMLKLLGLDGRKFNPRGAGAVSELE